MERDRVGDSPQRQNGEFEELTPKQDRLTARQRVEAYLSREGYRPFSHDRWKIVCKDGWAARYYTKGAETFLVTVGLVTGTAIVEILRAVKSENLSLK